MDKSMPLILHRMKKSQVISFTLGSADRLLARLSS